MNIKWVLLPFRPVQTFRPFAFRYAASSPSPSPSHRDFFNSIKLLLVFSCPFVFLSFLLLLIDIAGSINNEPDFIHSLTGRPVGLAIYIIIFNSLAFGQEAKAETQWAVQTATESRLSRPAYSSSPRIDAMCAPCGPGGLVLIAGLSIEGPHVGAVLSN